MSCANTRHIKRMLSTNYIGIDETRVLQRKDRKPQSKSSMWVRTSEELGIALFDCDVSKGAPAVNRLMLHTQPKVSSTA